MPACPPPSQSLPGHYLIVAVVQGWVQNARDQFFPRDFSLEEVFLLSLPLGFFFEMPLNASISAICAQFVQGGGEVTAEEDRVPCPQCLDVLRAPPSAGPLRVANRSLALCSPPSGAQANAPPPKQAELFLCGLYET